MDGLIVLLILIPLAVFVILITILSRTSEQQRLTETLYDRIKNLSDEIAGLSKEIKNLKQPAEIKTVVTEEKPIQKTAPPITATAPKDEIKPTIIPEIRKQEIPRPVVDIKKEEKIITERKEPPKIIVSSSEPETDLEKFIGENLLSKIGIAVLVLGI